MRTLSIASLLLIICKIRSKSAEVICPQKHRQLMAVLGEDSYQEVQIPYHPVKNRKNVYSTLIRTAVCRSFLLTYLAGTWNFLIFSLPTVLDSPLQPPSALLWDSQVEMMLHILQSIELHDTYLFFFSFPFSFYFYYYYQFLYIAFAFSVFCCQQS